jgi:hypothetical protein
VEQGAIQSVGEENTPEKKGQPVARAAPAAPTDQDRENARMRQEIAERMEAEYAECLALAIRAFGPGWLPSHRHFLVDKDEEEWHRRTGEKVRPAATVYTVKNAAGEQRHFTAHGGNVVPCEGYEAGFGAMLLEPHPTHGFEHQGRFVHVHRYSLCWAPYELYHPKSAEQLAALRESRERKKEERLDARFAEENPLFARAGITRQDLEGGGPAS